MAQFASDAFGGSDGAELSAYSGVWSKAPSATGNFQLIGGLVRATNTTSPQYLHSATPASADYSVSADLSAPTTVAGCAMGVTARSSTTAATFYHARWIDTSGGTLQLYKFVAGSVTLLGSSAVGYFSGTVNIKLGVTGTTVDVFWGGSATAAITVTDSSVTATGKAGIRALNTANPTDTTNLRLDNFSADEVGGSGPATGTLAATETGSDSAALSGQIVVQGTLAATETGTDTAAISGSSAVTITGSLAATETGTDSAASIGTVLVQGSLAATEVGSDTALINGSSVIVTTGSINATESGSDTATMTGQVLVQALIDAAEQGADTAQLVGQIVITGVLAASEVGSDTAQIYSTEPLVYIAGAQTRPSRLQSSSRPSRLQTGTRASR